MKYCNYNLIQDKNKSCALRTLSKAFLFFVLATLSMDAVAQNDYTMSTTHLSSNESQFYKEISFGEKIFFGKVDAGIKWTVTNPKENIFVNLSGNQINEYQFEKAGVYEVRFLETKKHSDECYHPQFDEKMMVKVNPVRMTFDFSKIEFSEKIQRGRNYEDLIITVPVTIAAKDNAILKLAAPGVFIAGIGVAMKAKPMNENIEIKNGIQVLKYKVSGIINTETYLMFDFYDFNNQVQTYNLRQIIN